eukprot:scaffold8740_cov113-Cylindrotheca_fusiformis.AAC.11
MPFHHIRCNVAIIVASILCSAEHGAEAYVPRQHQNWNGPFDSNWNVATKSGSIFSLAGRNKRFHDVAAKKRNSIAQHMRSSNDDSFHEASKPIKAVYLDSDSDPRLESEFGKEPQSRVLKDSSHSRVDLFVPVAYFCAAFAVTLPVILVPAIGYQEYQLSTRALTSFSTTAASLAMIGGGSGKFINGLVCQRIGAVATAAIYLAGMSAWSLVLSLSKTKHSVKWTVAGIEFCASAMWVACSIIFVNRYGKEPIKVARGVTYLSVASSLGQLLAKTIGSALLQFTDWRNIAKLGSLAALLGSVTVKLGLQEPKKELLPDNSKREAGVLSQIRSVMSSKIFWMAGCAHLAGHIAKSSDRILGPFLNEITTLPYQLCGALTSCVTLGFVHGVMKGQSYFKEPSVAGKKKMLNRWYFRAAISLFGLALCGSNAFRSLSSSSFLAAVAVICGGVCASSLAFPFYQIPNMVSTTVFPENQALSLSYLDGVAFILAAPVWALSDRITSSMGWSATWGFVFLVFGICRSLMMGAMEPVLAKES